MADINKTLATVAPDSEAGEGLVEKISSLVSQIDLHSITENEWVEKVVDTVGEVPEKAWYGMAAGAAIASTLLFTLTDRKTTALITGLLAPAFCAAGFYKGRQETDPSKKSPVYHH